MTFAIILFANNDKGYDVAFDSCSTSIQEAAEDALYTFGDRFAHVLTYSQFCRVNIIAKNGKITIA